MDGASNRGIDAIRDLTESVRYQPAMLRKKVYVIDEVHMLTTEAFNALLKTLEEPPPHVTFIFATTEAHKLPNTILSRVQRYDVKLVPASRLAQHLTNIFAAEKIKVDAGAISLLVRESGGSVRDALSLSDQIISYVGNAAITEAHVAEVLGVADRALTRTVVESLASGDAGTALSAVDAAIDRGVDEVQIARAVVRTLRDLSVLQSGGNANDVAKLAKLIDASDEERAELTVQAQALTRPRVAQMFERMLRCCDELGRTQQPRLVLDFALIDVATLEPLIPLGDLMDRLGALEGRLSNSSGGGRSPAPRVQAAPVAMARAPVQAAPHAAPPKPVAAAPVAASPKSAPAPSISAPSISAAGVQDSAAVWEQVLGVLHDMRKTTLAGYYEHARVLSWTTGLLELGFAPEFHFACEMAGDKARIEEIASVLREHASHKGKVTVRLLDASESAAVPARSLHEEQRDRAAGDRKNREDEARAHPATKMVLEAFGAQIKEIKTDV